MYVVIVGIGDLGNALVTSMVYGGHEVLSIDINPEKGAKIIDQVGAVFLEGDATNARTLSLAGVNRADVLIATTSKDDVNMAACLLAKKVFNTPRTIAIANSQDNVEVFKMSGIEVTVSITDLVLSNISGALPAHPLIRLMPIQGRGMEVIGVKIPTSGLIVGKSIKDSNIPYGSFIGLIIRENGEIVQPNPDTKFATEDEIIAVSPQESSNSLWDLLTESH